MKRQDLKAKMNELGVEVNDELIDFIMQSNGADINQAKSAAISENETLNNKISELTKKNEELTSKVDQVKDYEELVKFKTDTLAKETEKSKSEFLKSKGIKHPELLMNSINWDSLNYNADKKTFEGEGLEDTFNQLKEKYSDMFVNEEKQTQQTYSIVDEESKYDGMDGVERAFFERNPKLL